MFENYANACGCVYLRRDNIYSTRYYSTPVRKLIIITVVRCTRTSVAPEGGRPRGPTLSVLDQHFPWDALGQFCEKTFSSLIQNFHNTKELSMFACEIAISPE